MSLGIVIVSSVTMAACSASDNAPKVPLGTAASAAEAPAGAAGVPLPQAAKDLLEAGNSAYRAKQFDVAIARYREAAVAAPKHAAPWFGVYMAATATKNAALADSANERVQALSADTSALTAHADAAAGPGPLPPGHPGSTSKLPAGHPSTETQLPAGHPAPVKKP